MTATVATPESGADGAALDRRPDELPGGLASSSRLHWHPALLEVGATIVIVPAALVGAARAELAMAGFVVAGIVVLGWAMGGAFMAVRQPVCRLGAVLLSGTLLAAVWLAAAVVDAAGWTGRPADLATGVLMLAPLLVPAAALHMLLTLPRGERPGGFRLVAVVAAYGAAVVAGSAFWIGPQELPVAAVVAAWAVVAVIGLPASHQAYLASAGVERQRLQWLGCGAAVAAEVVVVTVFLALLVDWPARPELVAATATLLLPASLAAGASPRLVTRVDRLLFHTVSITGITAVTVAVYLVVVVGLGRVPKDSDRQLLGLSMLAAGVSAALYVPARVRLADVANGLVYGERHAPDEVLRTFGTRLSRAIPMDELLLQLAESLRKTLVLTRAEVWTGTPDLLERTVSVPYREPVNLVIGAKESTVVSRAGVSGQAWAAVWLPELIRDRPGVQLRVAPAVHSGELLGLLVIERPGDGDTFTDDDDTMLADLARQVGLALHNVQLDSALQATLDEVRRANEELQASRARIVAAADLERRKIERNLHDGAQQHLVALAVNLRLARDLLAEDTDTAGEMLDALAADVKETIAELRALAHGIYPPLLVDAGLGEALRAAANRNPLDVAVDVTATGRYGSEIEAAVYFCVLEAMQNAAKHAPGSSLTVRVWEEAGGLLFEVADDGPGFQVDASVRKGHGYTNMADRLGAIGGSIRWDSAVSSGTSIAGSVPLP
jgi:signal transduction histidine kinase